MHVNWSNIQKWELNDFLTDDDISKEVKAFLQKSVHGKCNMLLSGGTGSGKTTLLRQLASLIPANELVLAIEDLNEIQLDRKHFVSIETRTACTEPAVPTHEEIGKIVDFAFSKDNIDRILFGEFREGGAIEVIDGLTRTNKSLMGVLHATNTSQALERFHNVASNNSSHYEAVAFNQHMSHSLDMVIQVDRLVSGERRITAITQLVGYDEASNQIQLEDLYSLYLDEETNTYRLKRTEHTFSDKLKAKLGEV